MTKDEVSDIINIVKEKNLKNEEPDKISEDFNPVLKILKKYSKKNIRYSKEINVKKKTKVNIPVDFFLLKDFPIMIEVLYGKVLNNKHWGYMDIYYLDSENNKAQKINNIYLDSENKSYMNDKIIGQIFSLYENKIPKNYKNNENVKKQFTYFKVLKEDSELDNLSDNKYKSIALISLLNNENKIENILDNKNSMYIYKDNIVVSIEDEDSNDKFEFVFDLDKEIDTEKYTTDNTLSFLKKLNKYINGEKILTVLNEVFFNKLDIKC